MQCKWCIQNHIRVLQRLSTHLSTDHVAIDIDNTVNGIQFFDSALTCANQKLEKADSVDTSDNFFADLDVADNSKPVVDKDTTRFIDISDCLSNSNWVTKFGNHIGNLPINRKTV